MLKPIVSPGRLIPVSADLFKAGMVLPADLFIYLSLNNSEILFRKIGERLSDEDILALKKVPEKAIRVKFSQIGDLTVTARSEQIQEAVKNEDFKSKEVKVAAASVLSTIGQNPDEASAVTLKKISDKVSDIISSMKTTSSVRAYFWLLETAKKYRDPLEIHNREVSALAVLILMTIGVKYPEELAEVATAGLLHDNGLKEIPFELQEDHCKGRNEFTPKEMPLYQNHSDLTVELIKKEKIDVSENVLLAIAHHHENWDGTGHKGLVGNRISRGGRILRTADELACRLAAAHDQEEFNVILSGISTLSAKAQTAIFDPDIMLTLKESTKLRI